MGILSFNQEYFTEAPLAYLISHGVRLRSFFHLFYILNDSEQSFSIFV